MPEIMSKIKPLRPEDWPLLKAVRLAALTDSPAAFGLTLAEASAWKNSRWQENACRFSRLPPAASFLALTDGQPCGMVNCFVTEADPQTAEMTAFWVAPQQRGQGVGGALVAAIAGWAEAQGMTTLHAWVVEDNARALGFYRKHGFSETGRSEPHAPDPAKRVKLLAVGI